MTMFRAIRELSVEADYWCALVSTICGGDPKGSYVLIVESPVGPFVIEVRYSVLRQEIRSIDIYPTEFTDLTEYLRGRYWESTPIVLSSKIEHAPPFDPPDRIFEHGISWRNKEGFHHNLKGPAYISRAGRIYAIEGEVMSYPEWIMRTQDLSQSQTIEVLLRVL